ncbi:hypothetical protein QYF61_014685 [Mycteria americana]|uniref:Uncharacterized protein n=1 Tax=Mycteria americana TaxID=33587 RepID=A0AAN7N2J3_MYCAM|nr:hypothetical protein QYF61_014685 [Mycteria americana]
MACMGPEERGETFASSGRLQMLHMKPREKANNVSCHHFAVVALSSARKGQDGRKGSVVVSVSTRYAYDDLKKLAAILASVLKAIKVKEETWTKREKWASLPRVFQAFLRSVSSLNQLRDAFVRECELWSALAEARREDLESECGRCGLCKERELVDGGVAGHYPWEEMERAKCQHERTAPQLRPLIETEFQYEGGADTAPEIITKEIPYSATELAKLQDRYSRLPRETETECVWRVSLMGEDRIQLSEEAVQGYWGPGVFLTVPDT